ncbi:MAG: NADH-quinone oxidoreductase subunit C/D [Flavobacteriales bacterium]|jgi:NADH-quinone oxidoreductase subunit C/D
METSKPSILHSLARAFAGLQVQTTADGTPTLWASQTQVRDVLKAAKNESFEMLYDLTAIDERVRESRQGQPNSDFTIVYQLLSFRRNEFLRIKVALDESDLNIQTISDIWPNANWYERECHDMFGVDFTNHPTPYPLIMPSTWQGFPLRKEHPARATEMDPFSLTDEIQDQEQEALRFDPAKWGMVRHGEHTDFMFLNMGPNHPSVHGVFRIALQLDGEEIVDAVPDIGYHHRGAEKMGERQPWHSYMPYTDRIDYLGGVMNNLPYVLALEKMANIKVSDRVDTIRVMLCEMFRLQSHFLFLGTFAQDIGQMSPIFYIFKDREFLFGIIESITGGRMHPSWFRIGGVTQDLPKGWDIHIRQFLKMMPKNLKHYQSTIMKNRIFKQRTVGVGVYDTKEAIAWGVTGGGLRATGFGWDMRKEMPYSGYQNFEFDIPTGSNGDCYDRAAVRFDEVWQSLRIIEQCVNNMPEGPYKSDHPLTTPPMKDRTMKDIETLIHHFVNESWGPVIPAGEACIPIEATKGLSSYYIVSDGGTNSYRTRIRTPSFAHLQQIPSMSRGMMVADLIAIIASIDFVMADVDR